MVEAVRALCVALSDGREQTAELTIYPRVTGWSSLEPDDAEVAVNVRAFAQASLQPALATLSSPLRFLAPVLSLFRSTSLFKFALQLVLRRLQGGAKRVSVPLTTVSSLMQTQNLKCIDLLKIDVERSELAVLEGVDDADWPRVRQVASEVHDYDGRLQKVVALLTKKGGFDNVVTEQTESMVGSNLWMVFATRSDNA